MTRHRIYIMLALVFALLPATRARGQQAVAPREVFWTIAYYQVDWAKVDSLTKLTQAYTLPVVDEAKKAGGLLEYRMLIHSMAGRDNVVIMQKFSSWAAIHNDTSMLSAFRRVVPDSTRRSSILNAFNSIFGNSLHRDEIYTEVIRR